MIKFISNKTYQRMTKHYDGTKIIKKDKIIFMPQNPIYIKNEFKERTISFFTSFIYVFMPLIEVLYLIKLLFECLPVVGIVNKPDEEDLEKRTEADPNKCFLKKIDEDDDSETVEREQV